MPTAKRKVFYPALLVSSAVLAQPTTALVHAQFSTVTDSLRRELVLVAEQQDAVLRAMREKGCDTTALWPFAVHVMEVRALMHAAFDSIQRRNERVYSEDPTGMLYRDMAAITDGGKLYRRLDLLSSELLVACTDATLAAGVRTHLDDLFRGEDAETWALKTFYHVPAMALRPVLLKLRLLADHAARDALICLHHGCDGSEE